MQSKEVKGALDRNPYLSSFTYLCLSVTVPVNAVVAKQTMPYVHSGGEKVLINESIPMGLWLSHLNHCI